MKLRYRLILVFTFAVVLELGVFNFTNFQMMSNKSLKKDVVYTLEQMQKQNWTKSDTVFVSGLDPMMIIPDVNTYVESVKINANMDQTVSTVKVFYTNENNKVFSGNAMVSETGNAKGINTFLIGKNIKSLRFDLGEDAGTVLHNVTVTVNPAKLNFSWARVITVVLIYLMGTLLLKAQKMPDYNIQSSAKK